MHCIGLCMLHSLCNLSAPLASRQEVETIEVVVTTQQACEPKPQEPSIGPRGSKVRQQAPKTVAAKKTAKGKGKGKCKCGVFSARILSGV